LRLALIPLIGFSVWHILIYEMLVAGATMFHHADIGLGWLDRWLRLFVVTPNMHKVHHSDQQAETDSNYSTVLSIWDRLAGTFRERHDPKSIVFGLKEFTAPRWQNWRGMWKTPFVKLTPTRESAG
jgi:sterol desaturase/sphingolipid hydroxylase (fatty acid hydroxylase superfamily)